ncbi:hypothetical protein [Gordonibacter sp. An230]|uniref:hypothetical protein n=1 Tax=Gordonibacter sp. An230 TaxID=1965592 RepID=UPI001123E6B1|nr:hypothetical protein [Gordonibacter sp. An230]
MAVDAKCVSLRRGEPASGILSLFAPVNGFAGTWKFSYGGREYTAEDPGENGWIRTNMPGVFSRDTVFVDPKGELPAVLPGTLCAANEIIKSIFWFLVVGMGFSILLTLGGLFAWTVVVASVGKAVGEAEAVALFTECSFYLVFAAAVALMGLWHFGRAFATRSRMRRWKPVQAECVATRAGVVGFKSMFVGADNLGRASSWKLPNGRVVEDKKFRYWDVFTRVVGEKATVYLDPSGRKCPVLPCHRYRSDQYLLTSFNLFFICLLILLWGFAMGW